jgi:WD40 repeat protein
MDVLHLQSKLTLSGEPYVFDIDIDPHFQHALVSDSNQSLSLIDLTSFTSSQQFVSCHRDTITAIEFSRVNSHEIHSSSLDKTICFWDLRDRNLRFKISVTEEVHTSSLGLNGNLLAVGVGNEIHFYDLRSYGRPLGVYSDCHTDIVTKLQFHPENPSILLSGGEDGLICSFNTAVPPQHDAVLSIMNTECSVRDFGYFGSNEGFEGIYTISTIETLSFWHYPSAQRLSSYPNIRTGLGADYLVNCWYESASATVASDCFTTASNTRGGAQPQAAADKVYLLSGSHTGEGLIHEITPSSIEPKGSLERTAVSSSSASESSASSCSAGHNDTIRCVYPFGFKSPHHSPQNISSENPLSCGLFTGGEDGAVCLWRYNRPAPPPQHPQKGTHRSRQNGNNGAQDEGRYSKQLRYNPYK